MGCGQSTDGFSNHGSPPFPRQDCPGLPPDATAAAAALNNNNETKTYAEKDVEINRSTLEQYLQIERDIAEAERNNPLQPLQLKTEQLNRLTEDIASMEIHLTELQAQTEKEKEDVERLEGAQSGDLKVTLMEMGNNFDEQMAKEKAEYLAALNKEEIAEKELRNAQQQREQLASEVIELEKKAGEIQELYSQQDEILDKLFGGEYGSITENQLEAELDELETHRGRILEANFKWRQAQMMLEYACKQLAVAVQKWQDLPTIPNIDLEIRYSVAAETRNNLVAAGQNLQGAQRYLNNVQFPYCAPGEVDTLNKATEYVFTDMQSPERHGHAYSCYSTTHKRAAALLQWFDTVINSTIMKDLNGINEKVKEKTLELRRERIRLIQNKVREIWGTDIELEETLRSSKDTDIEILATQMLNENHVAKVDGQEEEDGRARTPPPLANDELAPMPSNTVIFGKMYDHYQKQLEGLASQHQQELEQFMKEQEATQQKVNQSLQEKLMMRRQRRARLRVEEAQISALTQ
ncbi:BH3-only protein sayonara [Oratosquilla oratoria]|uniref:BH3-only protein sayonara n=1 Tax=Oratosquilla oratoria TaxID=337810 RepID=UPI003F75965E